MSKTENFKDESTLLAMKFCTHFHFQLRVVVLH